MDAKFAARKSFTESLESTTCIDHKQTTTGHNSYYTLCFPLSDCREEDEYLFDLLVEKLKRAKCAQVQHVCKGCRPGHFFVTGCTLDNDVYDIVMTFAGGLRRSMVGGKVLRPRCSEKV